MGALVNKESSWGSGEPPSRGSILALIDTLYCCSSQELLCALKTRRGLYWIAIWFYFQQNHKKIPGCLFLTSKF